jgi:hypothetical protein
MTHVALLVACLLGQTGSFESSMASFEAAKRRAAWAEAESHVRRAIAERVDEYAVGSLSWTLLRQDRSDEALDTAIRMYRHFGATAYSLLSVIEAGVAEGAWDEIRPYVEYAKRNRAPASMPWQAEALADIVRRADALMRPTVYRLRWVIPSAKIGKNQTKRVKFPLLKTNEQTFHFTISGAAKHEIVRDHRATTVVSITGSGKDVVIDGVATLTQLPLGRRSGRLLERKPLVPGRKEDTGTFRYGDEVFDPKHAVLEELSQKVRRNSAYATIRAILEWRAKELPYGKLPAGSEDTLTRVMKHRTGVCHHISHIAVCLARANGVPAYVIGTKRLPEEPTFSNHDGSHGIIAVKFDGMDWLSLEPQDPNALLRFDGRRDLRFSFQGVDEEPTDESLQGIPVSGRRLP